MRPVFLILLALVAFSGPVAAQTARLGPSFDCDKARDPLAQLICASPDLSRTDLEFVQAYQALRQQVGDAGRKLLRQEAAHFQAQVIQHCAIPVSAPLPAGTGNMRTCVAQEYGKQRTTWLSRLTGPAADEANRAIYEQIELQRQLQELGFLPATATIDGVYGGVTRAAILAWQRSEHIPETGILGNQEAKRLAVAGPDLPKSGGAQESSANLDVGPAPEAPHSYTCGDLLMARAMDLASGDHTEIKNIMTYLTHFLWEHYPDVAGDSNAIWNLGVAAGKYCGSDDLRQMSEPLTEVISNIASTINRN